MTCLGTNPWFCLFPRLWVLLGPAIITAPMWVPTLPTLRVPTLVPTLIPARHLGQNPKKKLPKPCEIPRKMAVVCVISARPYKFQIIDISWYFLAYLPVIAKLPTFSSTGGGGSLVRASHEDIFPDFQQKKALGNLHRTSCTLARRPSSLRRIATSVSATEQQLSFRSSSHLFFVNRPLKVMNLKKWILFFGHWGTTLVHASSLLSASLTRKLQANDQIWHWPYWTYLRSQLETSSRIWTRPYKDKKKTARIRNLWIRDLNETCKSESSNVFHFCQAAMCDDGLIKPGPQQTKAILCRNHIKSHDTLATPGWLRVILTIDGADGLQRPQH